MNFPFSSMTVDCQTYSSRLVLLAQHHTIVAVLAHCLMLLIFINLHRIKLYFVLNLVFHVAEIVLTQKREQGILIANFALVLHFFGFHE